MTQRIYITDRTDRATSAAAARARALGLLLLTGP